jgi:hypothetical protein
MKLIILPLVLIAFNYFACQIVPATNNQSAPPTNSAAKTESNTAVNDANKPAEPTKKTEIAKTETKSAGDKSACLTAKIAGKRLIANQTFVFDYEPFKESCFVTFASKEDMLDEKDVPRGSTFYIFKDGKQIYDFEDAFDGQPACWVEGVGFEDLNGDGKTEVIIAGKCLAAKDSYPVNAIYENYQDDFHTYPSQNETLDNFTTIKQISDFAKKNPKEFFNRKK